MRAYFATRGFAVFNDLYEQVNDDDEELDHDVLRAVAELRDNLSHGDAFGNDVDPAVVDSHGPIDAQSVETVSDNVGEYVEDVDVGIAGHIARGLLPAPRGRPFENDAELAVDQGSRLNSHLLNIFDEARFCHSNAQSRSSALTPESLEHEVLEGDADAPLRPFVCLPDNGD